MRWGLVPIQCFCLSQATIDNSTGGSVSPRRISLSPVLSLSLLVMELEQWALYTRQVLLTEPHYTPVSQRFIPQGTQLFLVSASCLVRNDSYKVESPRELLKSGHHMTSCMLVF